MTEPENKGLCGHFVERIYRENAAAMTAKYQPDQSDIRSICLRCLRARHIELPKGYSDLGGLALCSCCGTLDDCRDPDVLRRYASAKIPPSEVFLRHPMLRQPWHGEWCHISVIDAIIRGRMGFSDAHD